MMSNRPRTLIPLLRARRGRHEHPGRGALCVALALALALALLPVPVGAAESATKQTSEIEDPPPPPEPEPGLLLSATVSFASLTSSEMALPERAYSAVGYSKIGSRGGGSLTDTVVAGDPLTTEWYDPHRLMALGQFDSPASDGPAAGTTDAVVLTMRQPSDFTTEFWLEVGGLLLSSAGATTEGLSGRGGGFRYWLWDAPCADWSTDDRVALRIWANDAPAPIAAAYRNTALSTLEITGATLDAAFDPATRGYSATADEDAESVTIDASVPEQACDAEIEITPADADPNTAGHQVAVADDPAETTRVSVRVTAAHPVAVRDYSVAIAHPDAPPRAVPELKVQTIVRNLNFPWGIAFTPDGTMLYTERSGDLSRRLPDGTTRRMTFDRSDLFRHNENGLMALVVDPDFGTNRRIYTCQGHEGPGGAQDIEVQVIAWTVNADYSAATRVNDPLVGGISIRGDRSGYHSGCRLRFGVDGNLWIGTGDGSTGTNPQDLSSLSGKVLRVDPMTGAAAAGNPIPGSRVYTFGHRNVQGLALRPGTSEMWSVEHGPAYDDEINLLVPGGNYGWDPVPGDANTQFTYYQSVPMTDLTKYPDAVTAKWTSGSERLAPSGGIFLEGDAWGAWEGRLAVAALQGQQLRVYEFDAGGSYVAHTTPSALRGTYKRLRTPMLGPDGALYITTSNGTTSTSSDSILRVTPKVAPVFAQDSYAVTVNDDTAVGTVIVTVSAQDLNHDAVTYSLSGADASRFSVGRSTGRVTLNAALDHGTAASHEFTVTATDTDAKTATATVTVTVIDADA